MAKKSIVTVGFALPDEAVDFIDIDSKASLIEHDIIIFKPDLSSIHCSENYQGYPCYSQSLSSKVREIIDHWRTQIIAANRSGKTTIILLPEKKIFYLYTGGREVSGTGRNARVTNHVEPKSNYDLLPLTFRQWTNAHGSKIELSDKSSPISEAIKFIFPILAYRSYFELDKSTSVLKVRGSDNVVGAVFNSDHPGLVLLLPDFNFEWIDLWEETATEDETDADEDDDGCWSQEAFARSSLIVQAALALERHVNGSGTQPPPNWLDAADYTLPAEAEALAVINQISEEIAAKKKAQEIAEGQLLAAKHWKDLLFAQGPTLERAVRDFFNLGGINAKAYAAQDMEFDVIFEFQGKRYIGEVEGKDNKPISVEKISQLKRCLEEDFSRDEVTDYANGILFGNAFRMTNPLERPGSFTEKVIISSVRSGITLVTTSDLFFILRDFLLSGDKGIFDAEILRIVEHGGGLFVRQRT